MPIIANLREVSLKECNEFEEAPFKSGVKVMYMEKASEPGMCEALMMEKLLKQKENLCKGEIRTPQ